MPKAAALAPQSWLLVYGATRSIATVIGKLALAAPFLLLRNGDHRAVALLGTWVICICLIAVYPPVKLE